MGIFSEKATGHGDRQHSNGNVRDKSNPDGARHASDPTITPSTHAVHNLKPTDYAGRHRSN